MALYTALFDACVLYSMPVADIVMELAATGLYRARWSEQIHDEWIRNVAKDRSDIPEEALRRRRAAMDKAIPQALVAGFEGLIDCLDLPDPDDRHVLAAAIVGRADVIVTFNLKDFPPEKLAPYDVEVQHPDEFLNHQRTLDEPRFLKCIKEIRGRLSKPKYEAPAYIDHLRKCRLEIIAGELAKVQGLI